MLAVCLVETLVLTCWHEWRWRQHMQEEPRHGPVMTMAQSNALQQAQLVRVNRGMVKRPTCRSWEAAMSITLGRACIAMCRWLQSILAGWEGVAGRLMKAAGSVANSRGLLACRRPPHLQGLDAAECISAHARA